MGLPFVGFAEAFRAWIQEPLDLLVSLVLVAVLVAFAPLALRRRLPVTWGALPFAGLVVVLSANVLREPFDFSRAILPVFTALPLPGHGSEERCRVDAAQSSDRGASVSLSQGGARTRGSASSWLVGTLGLAIGVVIALRVLIPSGMDPTIFLTLGEDSQARAGLPVISWAMSLCGTTSDTMGSSSSRRRTILVPGT